MSIVNFEEYTSSLSDEEKEIAAIVAKKICKNIGKENVVTNKKINAYLHSIGRKCSNARIRKIINYLRLQHIVPRLVANSSGYYISDDEHELKKYIYSLKQRARAIMAVSEVIDTQTHLMFNKQENS